MCDVHLSQSLDYKNQLQYDKNAIITEHVNTRLARTVLPGDAMLYDSTSVRRTSIRTGVE